MDNKTIAKEEQLLSKSCLTYNLCKGRLNNYHKSVSLKKSRNLSKDRVSPQPSYNRNLQNINLNKFLNYNNDRGKHNNTFKKNDYQALLSLTKINLVNSISKEKYRNSQMIEDSTISCLSKQNTNSIEIKSTVNKNSLNHNNSLHYQQTINHLSYKDKNYNKHASTSSAYNRKIPSDLRRKSSTSNNTSLEKYSFSISSENNCTPDIKIIKPYSNIPDRLHSLTISPTERIKRGKYNSFNSLPSKINPFSLKKQNYCSISSQSSTTISNFDEAIVKLNKNTIRRKSTEDQLYDNYKIYKESRNNPHDNRHDINTNTLNTESYEDYLSKIIIKFEYGNIAKEEILTLLRKFISSEEIKILLNTQKVTINMLFLFKSICLQLISLILISQIKSIYIFSNESLKGRIYEILKIIKESQKEIKQITLILSSSMNKSMTSLDSSKDYKSIKINLDYYIMKIKDYNKQVNQYIDYIIDKHNLQVKNYLVEVCAFFSYSNSKDTDYIELANDIISFIKQNLLYQSTIQSQITTSNYNHKFAFGIK